MQADASKSFGSPFSTTRQNLVAAVLAFAGMGASFIQTMLMPIQGELPRLLGADASETAWVITVTLLASSIAVPIAGRMGDMFGKRKVAAVLMGSLVVGSVVCALSPTLPPMIVGRALQGMGMGVIPLGVSMLRDVVDAKRLGTSIALVSATLGVGGAIGLPISTLVVENADWHMLFVVAAAISQGNTWGWTSPMTLTSLIVGVVVLLAWGWYQLRARNPLVDLRVSARPAVLTTNLASVAMGFAPFSSSIAFPQLLETPIAAGGLGLDLLPASLVLVPSGLAMLAMSPIAGRIERSVGPKPLLIAGAIVLTVAYLICVFVPLHVWTIAVVNTVIGVGVGLGYASVPSLIMGAVPRHETGAANGLNTLMRSFGTTVASAVVGAIIAASAGETSRARTDSCSCLGSSPRPFARPSRRSFPRPRVNDEAADVLEEATPTASETLADSAAR